MFGIWYNKQQLRLYAGDHRDRDDAELLFQQKVADGLREIRRRSGAGDRRRLRAGVPGRYDEGAGVAVRLPADP